MARSASVTRRVSARLKLSSVATVVGQLSEFDPVRAAYRQPDRDGVRVTPQDPERMSVQIVAEEGPEPTRIGPDDARLPPGSALRVADVQTPIAPTEPKPAEVPVSRLSFVVPPDESTPAEAVSPQLRDRLRALGYLE